MSGRSPSSGTFSVVLLTVSCTRPPSTTMAPSSTSTLVSMARMLVMMPAELVVSWTLDTSW